MMRNPGEELEETAATYAREAIRLDSQGNFAGSIIYYQNAVETLLKLIKLYPENPVNRMYYEKARAYQERIKALQRIRGVYGDEKGDSGSDGPHKGGIKVAPMVETVKASFEELLVTDRPNVNMEDVVGLKNAKLSLRQAIVYPFQRPDLFPLGWPRGILLFGPPGCGKTMLAAAVANEIDGYFLSVDAASIMSKWLGDAEKNVARLFSYARKLVEDPKPVIIFIDEVDSLLSLHRQEIGGEARVRNQFLKEMDGLFDKGRSLQLYVLAATNKPWLLDDAFLRRFQKRVYVQPSDLRARRKLFEKYTEPLVLDSSVKIDELAKITDGYSPSDIRDICQDAQLKVVTELFESGKASDPGSRPRAISMGDFKEIIKQRRPSLVAERVKLYEKWNSNYGAI